MVAKDERNGPAPAHKRSRPAKDAAAGGNVGSALRTVYEETVRENIPDEMLDLLGKLS